MPVGIVLLVALGPGPLAASTRPLASAVDAVGAAWAVPVVRVGAAVASLGALLALVAGVGRTGLAMARNGDLPRWLDSVHAEYQVPDHAELVVAAVVSVLVLTTDLRGAIGFSSFGVLTYYAIANASAFTQDAERRRWPRALNVAGLAACAVLVVTLPWTAVAAGAGMLAVGIADGPSCTDEFRDAARSVPVLERKEPMTSFRHQTFIKADQETIWNAITDADMSTRYGYGGRTEYDLRPGGAYQAMPPRR